MGRGARTLTVSAGLSATMLTTKRLPSPGTPLLSTVMVPSLQLGQALADRESQACPAEPSRDRGVRLAERLEQPVDAVRRDADAGVANRDVDFPVPPAFDRRPASGRPPSTRRPRPLGELDGVRQQIEDDLAQPAGIPGERRAASDRARRRAGGACSDAFGARRRSRPRCTARARRDRFELDPAGLDLREVEDVVDDRRAAIPPTSGSSRRNRAAPRRSSYRPAGRSCR